MSLGRKEGCLDKKCSLHFVQPLARERSARTRGIRRVISCSGGKREKWCRNSVMRKPRERLRVEIWRVKVVDSDEYRLWWQCIRTLSNFYVWQLHQKINEFQKFYEIELFIIYRSCFRFHGKGLNYLYLAKGKKMKSLCPLCPVLATQGNEIKTNRNGNCAQW